MTESSLRRACMRWLKTQPASYIWYVKYPGGPFSRSGVPDLLLCVGGRFVAVELKTETGRLTPMQQREASRIARAGGVVATVRSVAHLESLVAALRRQDAATQPRGSIGAML